jgi:hypothetical protein
VLKGRCRKAIADEIATADAQHQTIGPHLQRWTDLNGGKQDGDPRE